MKLKSRITVCLTLVLALTLVPFASQGRYLNPNTGQFQTMDTYEGEQEDPLSLHKYSYVANNPQNTIDPSGRESIASVVVSMANMNSLAGAISSPLGPTQAFGTGGPDVTETLRNTLDNIASTFDSWTIGQKIRAANELKDYKTTILARNNSSWDILELFQIGRGVGPNALRGSGGKVFRCGQGLWAYTVAVQGRVYHAGAVNYAQWGKMFRLIYDYFWYNSPSISRSGYTLDRAKFLTTAWKHWVHGDYGERTKQALAFTEFGYNGNLPSAGLPCKPSEKFNGNSFQWVWEPNMPRP